MPKDWQRPNIIVEKKKTHRRCVLMESKKHSKKDKEIQVPENNAGKKQQKST